MTYIEVFYGPCKVRKFYGSAWARKFEAKTFCKNLLRDGIEIADIRSIYWTGSSGFKVSGYFDEKTFDFSPAEA